MACLARPDAATLHYFSTIISLCSGGQDPTDDKEEKLESIKTILAVSDDDLKACTDDRSIRSTCRSIVRLVLKQELNDPTVSFGRILKDKKYSKVIAAIRGMLSKSLRTV